MTRPKTRALTGLVLLGLLSAACGSDPNGIRQPEGQQPGVPTNPGDPNNPVDPTNPGDPTNPVDPTNPGDPNDPGVPGDPGTPGGTGISCAPGIVATSQLPRLKNVEYDRTVRDLVGVTGLTASNNNAPSSLLATDQGGNLTDLGWSSYQTVAEMIAAQVMADATLRANYLSCDPAAAGCIDSTIASFGRRAFRRPLTTEEVALFQRLNDPTLTPTGSPEEIAELVLYGFLVSPVFLTRNEMQETAASNGYQLSSHEVASRLSYTIWRSMPDAELDAAADAGQLTSKEQILAQAQRMLADPKARDMVRDFHRHYLHIAVNSRWDTYVKEPGRFPAFNEALRAPLSQEVEMFFEQTAFGGGTFQDLLLSTQGYVNAQTAPLYGLAATGLGTDLSPTDLPGRPGFLTRVGWLAAYAEAARTSPIARGAFILKDVLGFDTGAPPPGASQTPLPEASAELNTVRKRVDFMTSEVPCSNCHHEYINPLGFVMEAFDAMGAPQTVEADSGAPIDTNVQVRIDDVLVPMSQPAELMAAIAASPGAQYYYAQKWVEYAFNRVPNPQDACTVEQLAAGIGQGGLPILNLIANLTQADSFTLRVVDTGVSP